MKILTNTNNKSFNLIKKINYSSLIRFVWIIVRTVLIIGLAFLIINPILIKFTAAIKSTKDLYDPTVFMLPKHMTFKNFTRVLEYINYPITLLKTIGLTSVIAFLQTVTCTLVAYGIARFKFKLRGLVFAIAIFTLVIPPQSYLLPLYMQFRYFNIFPLLNGSGASGINLINTVFPFLFLSATAVGFKNGLYIFMLRQFFKNMPVAIEEAAYIDGCSTFKTFYKIMLPGAVPMMVTVFLFSFVWQWNDYYYTAILGPSLPVFSAMINNIGYNICNLDNDVWNGLQIMIYNNVAILLHMVPLLILYVFTQRFFVQSIERSGLVG